MKVNNLFYLVMTSVIAALLLGILIQNQILIGKISNLNSVSQTSKNSFTKSVSFRDCPCPWINDDGSINVVIKKSKVLDVNIHSISGNGILPVYLAK